MKYKYTFIAFFVVTVGVIVGGLFVPKVESLIHLPFIEKKSQKILFVGDMLFDRYIRQTINRHGEEYVFSDIDGLLRSGDLVVGNLEGPITAYTSVSMGSKIDTPDNFRFTFPTSTAEMLARHNIRLVNLGNNHISNFGQEGIAQTKQYLKEADIGYFGGLAGDEPVYRTKDVSFVSFNQFGGQSREHVASLIAAEKERGQMVFVYAHWGEEYARETPYMKETARTFVEHGADAVIGSHPHVVIPRNSINDVPIYYSLGNFIFDQYWDEEVRTGLAVLFEIQNHKIKSVSEYEVSLTPDGKTSLK